MRNLLAHGIVIIAAACLLWILFKAFVLPWWQSAARWENGAEDDAEGKQ